MQQQEDELLLSQARIALCAIVACGVSLSNAAHARLLW